MKTFMRYATVIAALTLGLAPGACTELAGAHELQALSGAIKSQFQSPANVRLEGTHLTVTVQNDTYVDPAAPDRESFARSVAQFAFTHYASRETLTGVSVGFRPTKGALPDSIARKGAPYSWSKAALRAAADSEAAATAAH